MGTGSRRESAIGAHPDTEQRTAETPASRRSLNAAREPDALRRTIMPALAGPVSGTSGVHYRRRDVLIVRYASTTDAIESVLPECFVPGDPPLITAYFADCDGVDFLAGRDYRLAAIMVPARFDGEHDHIEGAYALVMFEDEPLGVITGRELLGVAKLYADISPIRVLDGNRLCCEVSVWGHRVLSIELEGIQQADSASLAAAKQRSEVNLLGYKYIPALDGSIDAAYPIVTPMEVQTEQLWMGKSGRISYGDPQEQDVGFIQPLIAVLRSLPTKQFAVGLRSVDSVVLRTDLARRLY